MKQERFFRLLSIAMLGACALAIVPEVKPSSEAEAAVIANPEVEMQAAQDVELINSGKFKPYVSGDVTPTYDSGAGQDAPAVAN